MNQHYVYAEEEHVEIFKYKYLNGLLMDYTRRFLLAYLKACGPALK